MKIAIFIHEDYDFTFEFMGKLIPILLREHEVSGIHCFPNIQTKYKGAMIYLKYLEIFGLSVFLKLCFKGVVKRLTIIKSYIFNRRLYYSFSSMFSCYGIRKLNFKNPNDDEVISWVKENKIDIILLFVGYILKDKILKAPRICILNKHSSILPSNKGIFPIFWALIKNEPIGVTIHKVNGEIDGGEIVLQKEYKKHEHWSVYDYYNLIFSDAPNLIVESIELVKTNSLQKIKHDIIPSYHGLPTRKDYLNFKKMDFKFI